MIMNCFYRMIDRGKAFNLISIRYHCQRSSPQQISGITNFQVPSQITAQKMKFFIKDFFSKCDQIRIFQWKTSFFVQWMLCHSPGNLFLASLPSRVLELQSKILYNTSDTRIFYDLLLHFLWITLSIEKKTVMTTFLDNFRSSRPEVFFNIAVLKYLRKFPRKHPWRIVFVNKMKENIVPRRFS